MTKLFLKAKNWQIFILLFTYPLISLVNNFSDTPLIEISYQLGQLLFLFEFFLIFCWVYFLVKGLKKHLPEAAKLNYTRFVFSLILPWPYMIFLEIIDSNLNDIPYKGIIVPVHLITMYCMFYCIYILAKTIAEVEKQRPCKFSDYIALFFMIWYLPIGILFIQPRVNKISQDYAN